jgi:hypothetical protein
LDGDGLALTAALAERLDDAPERVEGLVDRDQPISPTTDDARRPGRHGGAEQARRLGGQAPKLRSIDVDRPVVGDLVAPQQRSDNVDALQQAGIARRLVRPAIARDVFVERLSRTERCPEPAGIELGDRRDRLREDHRMVALSGRGHDPERKAGRLHGGAEPRPGEPGMSLPLAPRCEMIRAHRRAEAGVLGRHHRREERARRKLLM